MKTLRIDFGHTSLINEGYFKAEAVYRTPRCLWVTPVRIRWSRDESVPGLYRDHIAAGDSPAEFRMGLPAGAYDVTLLFRDPDRAHEPFRVTLGAVDARAPVGAGRVYEEALITPDQGQAVAHRLHIEHQAGALALRVLDGGFISAMEVEGGADFELAPLYDDAIDYDRMPSIEEAERAPRNTAAESLRAACEWLFRLKDADGFIGENDHYRFWYTAAYPLRTLLAGWELFGRRDYYEASVRLLDEFIAQQMPEGAYPQRYLPMHPDQMTLEELERVRDIHWMNLADVGSMVIAVLVACRYVDAERRQRYLASVRRFFVRWAMRSRRDNGGFDNGWVPRASPWGWSQKVYGVSTANMALAMMLYARITGEEAFAAVAGDAVLLLTRSWHKDGRNLNWVFEDTYPGFNTYQSPLEFGDTIYTLECLSGMLALAASPEIRSAVFEALRRHILGSAGLIHELEGRSWWPVINAWDASKSAAAPLIFRDFLAHAAEFDVPMEDVARVRAAYERLERFLLAPDCARLIGVCLKDPVQPLPFQPHAPQSWANYANAATGFAGIFLADVVQRGMNFRVE